MATIKKPQQQHQKHSYLPLQYLRQWDKPKHLKNQTAGTYHVQTIKKETINKT